MAISRIEELDFQETPMGELTLRRRREPMLDVDVYEVKLGEEYLMSSLFTVAEIALSDLGLVVCSRHPRISRVTAAPRSRTPTSSPSCEPRRQNRTT